MTSHDPTIWQRLIAHAQFVVLLHILGACTAGLGDTPEPYGVDAEESFDRVESVSTSSASLVTARRSFVRWLSPLSLHISNQYQEGVVYLSREPIKGLNPGELRLTPKTPQAFLVVTDAGEHREGMLTIGDASAGGTITTAEVDAWNFTVASPQSGDELGLQVKSIGKLQHASGAVGAINFKLPLRPQRAELRRLAAALRFRFPSGDDIETRWLFIVPNSVKDVLVEHLAESRQDYQAALRTLPVQEWVNDVLIPALDRR